MHKRTLVALALAVLTMPVWAQDKPATEEKKLTFKMKDASVDAVLQYVSSVTGWIFVQEKATSGTVSAVSDTDVPLSKVLDFLNSALRPHDTATPCSVAARLMRSLIVLTSSFEYLAALSAWLM